MTDPEELPQTTDDDRPPADTDHPASNSAVHIPVEQYRTRIQNRFLNHIEPTEDGCWEWTASLFDTGYGQFRDGDTMREAHRVAYRLFALDDITDDELVRHKCPQDSLSCCNPAHLTTGTHRDNWLDAVEDGDIDLRFTPAEIREIRRRYQREDLSQGELGEEFDVSQVQIGRIVRREDYDFVEEYVFSPV